MVRSSFCGDAGFRNRVGHWHSDGMAKSCRRSSAARPQILLGRLSGLAHRNRVSGLLWRSRIANLGLNFEGPRVSPVGGNTKEGKMRESANWSRRDFLTTTAVAVGTGLLSKLSFTSAAQDPVVNTTTKDGKPVRREKAPWKVLPFPLKQVRLGEGPCKSAMDADRAFLNSLPPDRLLHTFRLNAGLPSSAEPLGGWEKPDCELCGRFAGEHYVSACALAFTSSNDEQLKRSGDLMVTELAKCRRNHEKDVHTMYLLTREHNPRLPSDVTRTPDMQKLQRFQRTANVVIST